MARIRTVKPEFFRHEGLFDAERESGLPLRLAFAGLWTVCDREGRFKWKPRELKLDVLPHDAVDMDAVLAALAKHGFVRRYEAEGKAYGFVPSWRDHQFVNQRESQSVIPAPPDGARTKPVHAHAPTAEEYQYRGVNIQPRLRALVFARDGNRCLRCEATDDLTVDHIFPQNMGGTHALANLRTLCRSCNSARPVTGAGLIADLEKDGFTMEDMQRICAHVHARGEREQGREGNGKEERAADAPPASGKTMSSPSIPAKQSSCELGLDLPRALDRAADLKEQIFGPCLAWLGERTKKPADKYRSLVGRWLKEWGDAAVLDAFLRARKESPLEPVAWIEATLRAGERKNGKAVESTGPDWNRRVEDFRARNFWLTSWGAAPTDPGCQAPAPILHQHGYRTEAA